jgi:hypothetical protein
MERNVQEDRGDLKDREVREDQEDQEVREAREAQPRVPGPLRREGNELAYADKTRYLFDLFAHPGFYLLARPEGFGKSTTLAVLAAILTGDREALAGTWIARSGYRFPVRPVIRMDLGYHYAKDNRIIKAKIKKILVHRSLDDDFKIRYKSIADFLPILASNLAKKYQEKVAILVDNFDEPLINNLDDKDIFNANKKLLTELFAAIKSLPEHIDLVLATGLTSLNIISHEPPALTALDISLDPRFNAICGLTSAELDEACGQRLAGTLRRLRLAGGEFKNFKPRDLKEWMASYYGGYRWGGAESVINPSRLTQMLVSGAPVKTPGPPPAPHPYLAALIRRRPWDFQGPEPAILTARELAEADPASASAGAALFWTGHLTLGAGETLQEMDGAAALSAPGRGSAESLHLEAWRALGGGTLETERGSEAFLMDVISGRETEIAGALSARFRTLAPLGIYGGAYPPRDRQKFCRAFLEFYLRSLGFVVDQRPGDDEAGLVLILTNGQRVIIELDVAEIKAGETFERRVRILDKPLARASARIRERRRREPLEGPAARVLGLALVIHGAGEVAAETV